MDPAAEFRVVVEQDLNPLYDESSSDADVALLRLSSPVSIAPVSLRRTPLDAGFVGSEITLVGFGATESQQARKRSGTTVVDSLDAFSFRYGASPAMTCKGDSGGPALIQVDGSWALVGITSAGDAACVEFGVDARVDTRLDFIDPILAAPSPTPVSTLALDGLCTASCEVDEECPSQLVCQPDDAGVGHCVFPQLEPASFADVCASDSDCAAGPCVPLDAGCRCQAMCAPQARIALVDVTAAAGIDHRTGPAPDYGSSEAGRSAAQNGTGVAVGDIDADGDLDLYLLANRGTPNRLYLNVSTPGAPRFEDITPPVLADEGQARVAFIVDLDHDGKSDIVLLNDVGPTGDAGSKIFRGDGAGGFTDVSATSGFSPRGWPIGGASIADVNGDGELDIYVTIWSGGFGSGAPVFAGMNELYLGDGGLRFHEATRAQGLGEHTEDSFTPVFAQFDRRAGLDLFVSVDKAEDMLFVRRGGRFRDVSERVGVTHVSSDMGVAAADFDDDDDLDLFTTNIFMTDVRFQNRNAFYENQLSQTGELSFVDRAESLGVADTRWGWGTEAVDLDLDGDLDLVAVNGFAAFADRLPEERLVLGPGYLFENRDGVFVRAVGTDLDVEEDARALVAFDADSDGDPDLLITTMDGPVRLLDNRSARGDVVELRLEPPALAFGAVVRGAVGGVRKRRDALAARSYLVGAAARVRFGLGVQTRLSDVDVQWADGVRTPLPDLEAGASRVVRRCAEADECSGDPAPCVCVEAPPQASGCAVSHGSSARWLLVFLLALVWASRRRRTRG
ncbi:MAG: trypsin-like serine protease [Deltaproteobacteria bacterium]|nr:trypsin-like serine protease [Deltaproteobacteria bacterium]